MKRKTRPKLLTLMSACLSGPERQRWRRSLRSSLVQRDVRRVLRLHADDILPGVDMVDFTGHARRKIGEQIKACAADILDRHIAAQRRVQLVPLEDIAEVADARWLRAS